ncbi:MAG: amino acid permease [Pseudomonadales bacterium]|nr:amino acid permease [Pseudomonadales bacterium]MCP5193189.1 amino acid permease [Pseudomonadales bacterium]
MIVGVILYLRLGQVTGQAGLWDALLVIGFAQLITLLTALSLSSIATNTRVRGGGAYYLISRSLGVEYGGAIGPVFYLALAASVALYVLGFTETLLWIVPDIGLPPRECASLVNLLVFASVFIGAGWTIRIQYFILAIIALSLVSFFWGAIDNFSLARLEENLTPGYTHDATIFTVFALFFPAVTGIMAGANMSGDLQDAGRSIPRGTLIAIAITAVIYCLAAVALAGANSRAVLLKDSFVMGSSARWPVLVVAGMITATLSSALSSMMGAPRILQALARDGVFSSLQFFAQGSGRNHEPRRAMVLTFVIAQCGILLGDLDTIAPLITMFFIITYGAINLSCFYESVTGNPSYRPVFSLNHWSIGLAGAAACVLAMLLVAPIWAVLAIAGISLLLRWVKRRELKSYWGDARWGNSYERARRALLSLEAQEYHPRSWRPSILAVGQQRWSSQYRVAEYACWLQGNKGIVTLAQVEHGDIENRMRRRRSELALGRQFVRDEGLEVFYTVIVEDDLLSGLRSLLQSHGIGNVRPNTVLFEWPDDADRVDLVADLVETSRAFDCSVVAVRGDRTLPRWETREGPVDVWWHSRKNGALMLIFAHLITRTPAWRDRPVRLLHTVATQDEHAAMLLALEELIATSRIAAQAVVLVGDDLAAGIRGQSGNSALVILGIDPIDGGTNEAWHADIQQMISGLPEVILISNAGDMRLGD